MSNEGEYSLRERIKSADKDYATKHFLADFLRQYVGVPFSPDMFQGRILIGGGASGIVERALFCKPPEFNEPSSLITSIWTVDVSNALNRSVFPSFPLKKYYSDPEDCLEISKSTISYSDELVRFLKSCPEGIFNTITFFGIPNFVDQCTSGFFNVIQRSLAPSGIFMGSGGNYTESIIGFDPPNILKFTDQVAPITNLTTIYADQMLFNSPAAPANDSICVILQKN